MKAQSDSNKDGLLQSSVEIGGNPLPRDAQEKLGEFIDWLDVHYDVDIGTTALYWGLSYDIAARLQPKKQ